MASNEIKEDRQTFERVHLGTKVVVEYGLKNSEGDMVKTFYVQATTQHGSKDHWIGLKDLIDREAEKQQAEMTDHLNQGNLVNGNS